MSAAPVPPARILVVEDLDHNRELCRLLLTRAGYDVAVAANGAEAVAAVSASRFDLVLMDIQLPVMDGLAAARAIRALGEEASGVTIIGMSANTMPDQIRAFEEAGIDAALRKPFRRNQLLEAIEPWLARAQERGPMAAEPARSATEPGPSDLLDLLGRDWVITGLVRLEAQIDEAFAAEAINDTPALARQAHAIVSQAGLLGFKNLSDRASALEEACLTATNIATAFASAKAAALAVRGQVARFQATNTNTRGS